MKVTTERLLDPFEVRRPRPANLTAADEPLFLHEFQRAFPETDLFVLRDVHVTSEGTFIEGFTSIDALGHAADERLRFPWSYALRRRLLRRTVRFTDGERYVTAFNAWSARNYFHWMCDVLPRVFVARDHVAGSVFVLPDSHDAGFIEATLAAFRPNRIQYFDSRKNAFFRTLTVPGHIAVSGNYHESTMRDMVNHLQSALGVRIADEATRRVYVTRRKAAFRYIVNEAEVEALLQSHGFEIVANEDLTFQEQIDLYSSTQLLVGIIGANLTNTMFMPAGSAMLQLTREGDDHNHLYYALAVARNVVFYYQHCAYVDTRPGDYWNLVVDIERLRANLELMEMATT